MGVPEDAARALPAQGLKQCGLVQAYLTIPHRAGLAVGGEPGARRVVLHPCAGEAHGIAVGAARRDDAAAVHRVDGGVGPFDLGMVRHGKSPCF